MGPTAPAAEEWQSPNHWITGEAWDFCFTTCPHNLPKPQAPPECSWNTGCCLLFSEVLESHFSLCASALQIMVEDLFAFPRDKVLGRLRVRTWVGLCWSWNGLRIGGYEVPLYTFQYYHSIKRLWSFLFWLSPGPNLQLPRVRNHPAHESEGHKTEPWGGLEISELIHCGTKSCYSRLLSKYAGCEWSHMYVPSTRRALGRRNYIYYGLRRWICNAELEGRPERISIPFPVVLQEKDSRWKLTFKTDTHCQFCERLGAKFCCGVDTDPMRNSVLWCLWSQLYYLMTSKAFANEELQGWIFTFGKQAKREKISLYFYVFGAVHLEFSVVRGNEHLVTILISHYVQIVTPGRRH